MRQKNYPTNEELNKKWWYKTGKILKWIIVVLAFLAPFITKMGGIIDGIMNAVLWYLILSFLWYITKLFIYGKKPKKENKN